MTVARSKLLRASHCIGLALLVAACGGDSPSLTESLAAQQEKPVPENYKPNPKPRPTGLDGPTEAEFKAWNRKDPEGEKYLYKWDKAHLPEMLGYWEQMQCFREKVKEAGQKAFGAEPGSPPEEQWFQFKRIFINQVDGWQKRLFAEQPRIQEKSKFIGNFLEAHELVMNGYPKAFNESDTTELEKADAHWIIVEAKVKKYVKSLGEEWPSSLEPTNPKDIEKHAKVCEQAMRPPDRDKPKKRKRKGAI